MLLLHATDDYAPPEHKARWFATFYLCIPVGFAAGYVYGGLVAASLSWRAAFFIESAIMVPFVVFASVSKPLHLAGSRDSGPGGCWGHEEFGGVRGGGGGGGGIRGRGGALWGGGGGWEGPVSGERVNRGAERGCGGGDKQEEEEVKEKGGEEEGKGRRRTVWGFEGVLLWYPLQGSRDSGPGGCWGHEGLRGGGE